MICDRLLGSVPLFFVSVGFFISGRLLEPDIRQHVPHCNHQTIDFLVELLSGSGHFHVALQLSSTLHTQRRSAHLPPNRQQMTFKVLQFNSERVCRAAVLVWWPGRHSMRSRPESKDPVCVWFFLTFSCFAKILKL